MSYASGNEQVHSINDDTKRRVMRELMRHKRKPDLIIIEGYRFHALTITYNSKFDNGFTRNYEKEQWEIYGIWVQKGPRGSGIQLWNKCCVVH